MKPSPVDFTEPSCGHGQKTPEARVSNETRYAHADTRRDLTWSLALISVVVLFALIGLASDRNWPKVLRVGVSFAVYASVLLALARFQSQRLSARNSVPFAWFVLAAASAGIVSGLVRPQFRLDVLVAGTIASALLLGSVHWFALRTWEKLFDRTVRTRGR